MPLVIIRNEFAITMFLAMMTALDQYRKNAGQVGSFYNWAVRKG